LEVALTIRVFPLWLLVLSLILSSFGCDCGDDDDDDDNDATGDDEDDDDDSTDDDDDDNDVIDDDDDTGTDDDDDDDTGTDDDDDDDDDDNNDDDSVTCVPVWSDSDVGAIVQKVALADTVNESWVGYYLNNERFSHYQTSGNGTPVFEYGFVEDPPDNLTVASAEDASLGILAIRTAGEEVVLMAFDSANGVAPIWTFTFDTGYDGIGKNGLDVTADGSIVAASAYVSGGAACLLILIDGATGIEIDRYSTTSSIGTVELSDDGTRILAGISDTAVVLDADTFAELHSFQISGSGGTPRISRDGTAVAAGGFDIKAYREGSKGWDLVFTEATASNWYGDGIAISGDGTRLISVSRNYTTDHDLTYRIEDLISGTELARTTTTGVGAYQDSVVAAQASETGDIFSVATWGLELNEHPEVQIFDSSLNRIGEIDMPGSPFSLDMSLDGRYIIAGGKAVHANELGSGGDVMVCEMVPVD
jgi:hypothetical protein